MVHTLTEQSRENKTSLLWLIRQESALEKCISSNNEKLNCGQTIKDEHAKEENLTLTGRRRTSVDLEVIQ